MYLEDQFLAFVLEENVPSEYLSGAYLGDINFGRTIDVSSDYGRPNRGKRAINSLGEQLKYFVQRQDEPAAYYAFGGDQTDEQHGESKETSLDLKKTLPQRLGATKPRKLP